MKHLTLVGIAEGTGLHKTSIMRRAEKEAWPYEETTGRGGKKRLYPVASLPADVRQALQKDAIERALPVIAEEIAAPVVYQAQEHALTDKQRAERDARAGVKAAIMRTMACGCSKEAALTTLLTSARAGTLDPLTTRLLALARDARGRAGDGFPSIRTLKRWLASEDLAPKVRQADMRVPPWAKAFLAHYQQPSKPSVLLAYGEFCAAHGAADAGSSGRSAQSRSRHPEPRQCRGRRPACAIPTDRPRRRSAHPRTDRR